MISASIRRRSRMPMRSSDEPSGLTDSLVMTHLPLPRCCSLGGAATQHVDDRPLALLNLVNRVGRVLEVAFLIECKRACDTLPVDGMYGCHELRGIRRAGLLRGGNQGGCGVIRERRVQFD